MSIKSVLIITDGNETIDLIARSIKNELKNSKVKITPAENFSGTEILPVQMFFLGCKSPAPKSFAYLEDMLLHINFAGRKCGIFSDNEKSLKYLGSIVKYCEANLEKPLLFARGIVKSAELKKWLNKMNG